MGNVAMVVPIGSYNYRGCGIIRALFVTTIIIGIGFRLLHLLGDHYYLLGPDSYYFHVKAEQLRAGADVPVLKPRQEVEQYGIRVHAICPGGVDTSLVAEARPDLDRSVLMQPDEIAEIVLFLLTRRGNAVVDQVNVRRATSQPWF